MNFRFDPETHAYFIGDTPVPSVTQILSAAGFTDEKWFRGRHRGKGTAVHEGCTLVDQGVWDPDTTHPDIVPYIRAYESFCRDTGFKSEVAEQPLYSERWMYGGQLDRWGWVDAEHGIRGVGPGPKSRWLVDVKSGSRTVAADIQVALYDVLVQEQLQFQTDERVILLLKDDGKYKIDTIKNGKKMEDVAVGLSAVRCWWWRKNHGKL